MFADPVFYRYRPRMLGDPLSDILRLTNARPILTGGLAAGNDWSLRFPAPSEIKFLAISGAGAWLCLDGERDFTRLNAGDVLLLADRRGFVLTSDPKIPPTDAAALFAGKLGKIVSIADSGEIQLIGGHVALDPTNNWLLSSVLSPVIHIGADSPEAPTLRWLVQRLIQEGFSAQPGANIAATQIAQLLFVYTLRAFVSASASLPASVLRAAADPHLSRALRLIHAEPGRPWRLIELAQAAGMSRTIFAERFKRATGLAPISYITKWRMLLAAHAIKEEHTPIGKLAHDLGYTSESAFSHAFKRITGTAPSDKTRGNSGQIAQLT